MRLHSMWGIRGSCLHFISNRIIEVELRRKFTTTRITGIGTYLEMNMNSSARIPSWINGDKTHAAIPVRYLTTAQELLSYCIEIPVLDIRIDSLRIAMPDVDYGVGKGQALVRTLVAHRENAHFECKRKAVFYRVIGRIGSNV